MRISGNFKGLIPEKKEYLQLVKRTHALSFFKAELTKLKMKSITGRLSLFVIQRIKRESATADIHLGDKLVKIDHHPNEDPYGDLLWVDTNASSVSEMIYEFYLFGKDNRTKDE